MGFGETYIILLVSTVPADGLAVLGAMSSADTVMIGTWVGNHVYPERKVHGANMGPI